MSRRLRAAPMKLAPPRRQKLRPSPKVAASFYTSPEWKALRDEIIKERGRRCEDPAHDPLLPRDGLIFGDHIVELNDGGAPLDKRNVMLRCGSCHTRKTAEARAKRLHGG